MLAFAANSLLCRLALGFEQIDAASFTSVRLISGAVMMAILLLPGIRARERHRANWRSVFSLFAYMICFSLAYLSLTAGTGALILFGAVQLTMILSALRSGERFVARSLDRIGAGRDRSGLPGTAGRFRAGPARRRINDDRWRRLGLLFLVRPVRGRPNAGHRLQLPLCRAFCAAGQRFVMAGFLCDSGRRWARRRFRCTGLRPRLFCLVSGAAKSRRGAGGDGAAIGAGHCGNRRRRFPLRNP